MKRWMVGVCIATLTLVTSCSYDTVHENQSAVKTVDGHFTETIKRATRVNTSSLFHDVEVVSYDVGLFESVFSANPTEGDRKGNDAIIVNTSDKAQPAANVNVTAQFDRAQIECLYKASIMNSDDFKNKVLRGEINSAVQQLAAMVPASEFATRRKGEIANAALVYVQQRFDADTPNLVPVETDDPASVAIKSLHPSTRLPKSTSCGTKIIRLQITRVTLPTEQQKQLDGIIAAEADRQKAVAGQATKEAEAKGNVIKAQGDADALRISAQGQADANRAIAGSMTPGLIELERTKACAEALAKTQAKVASCGGSGAGGTNSTVVIPAG